MQDSFPVFVSVALEPSPTEGAFSSIGAVWMRRSDTGPELRPSSCVWFSHQLGRGRGATAAHDDVTPALARSRAGPGRVVDWVTRLSHLFLLGLRGPLIIH
jgi:hypothetical protein